MALTVFKWPISKFSEIVPRRDAHELLESDEFELGDSGIDFTLALDPTYEVENEKVCSIDLYTSGQEDYETVNVQSKIWLESVYGEKLPNQPLVKTYKFEYDGDNVRGDFVRSDELYSPDFLKNDTILVCCEILFIAKIEKYRLSSDLKFREKQHSFYKQGVGDFTREAEGRKLNVSKSVLMANSKVFERMIMSETQESKEGFAIIKEVRAETMEKFVDCLYLGKLENLDEFAEELFVLADRYLVERLKDDCKLSLVNSLSEDNIVSRLRTAFKYNYTDLKKYAWFYAKGIFPRILESVEWKELASKDRKLADEICLAMFKS